MRVSYKDIIVRLLQIITIVLISMYFINMYRSVSAVKISFSYNNIWAIIVSIGLISIGFLLLPIPTLVLLRSVGKEINFVSSMKIFFFSEVGKYMPGKIWVVVGRVMMYSKMGVDRERAIFILALELFLMIFTAIILPGTIIIHYITLNYTILGILIFFILIILYLITWRYQITIERIGKYIYIFTRPAITIFFVFTLFWMVLGGAFQCLVLFLTQINIGFFHSMQIFSASWAAGFLAFFMPLGLGVREVFMTELLVPVMGNENAFLIAVGSRIWWTFIEATFILFSSGKMFSVFLRTNTLPEIIK